MKLSWRDPRGGDDVKRIRTSPLVPSHIAIYGCTPVDVGLGEAG
jgi:hypothetical protein